MRDSIENISQLQKKLNDLKLENQILKNILDRAGLPYHKELAHNIIEFLRPMREKRAYYEARPEEVDKIILEGTKKARKKAKETMQDVKKAMRLDYFQE